MNYVPLNVKTDHDLLNSLITVNTLIDFAKINNLKSLGIANHNMYGAIEFYRACIKNNIKPIIGLEINHKDINVILYAINKEGYYSLNKLSTIISERDILVDDIKRYQENLVIVSFDDKFVGCKHLYNGIKNDIEKENALYIKEVNCLNKEDKVYLPYLKAIKEGLVIDQIDRDFSDSVIELNINNNLKANEEVVKLCNVVIDKEKDMLPKFVCPNDISSSDYLKELCKNGLKELFGERVLKVYIDRLKYELDIINKMGFNDYFLIVSDYVKYAKEKNILVGPGRGSAAGSLVSYVLGITAVDPIKNHLLFERFLNPERISMPDIDIDFEDYRRDEVVNYCINKYGMKKVVGIITFGTLGSKQVIRDVGRASKMDPRIIDQVNKLIDSKLSLKDNYEKNTKLSAYLHKDEALMRLYKVAMRLEGTKRHTSVHAAGIVMGNYNLDEVIPLYKHHDGLYLTGYTMEYLEDLGLLKMDFLALRNLTLLNEVVKDLAVSHINIDLNKIVLDDLNTYDLFANANTIGIFQFESPGMMNFLRKFKPSNFEDLSAAVALFRPGPINNIDSYIKRKNGEETIDYFNESLKNILEPTYGIIIYQEQIMQIANVMAGYSLGEADVLRRAMSKKKEDVLLKEKTNFVNRSVKLGYDKDISDKVYNLILRFADYGFNRAHAVSYALIAYQMAYLKANYPKYFMKSLLNLSIGSDIKTKDYIYEARLYNIDIIKPDINLSTDKYELEDLGIRFPLNGIRNVGLNAVKSILDERKKGRFLNIYDFVKRTYGKTVNKKTIESLIDAGVFSSFSLNKSTLNHNLDAIINYAEIAIDDSIAIPQLVIQVEFNKVELMQKELEAFGFYFTNHPVTMARLKIENTIKISEVSSNFNKIVDIIVLVDSIREIETKKKEKMVFITGSDEVSAIDLVIFPKIYQRDLNINKNDIILVNAKVEKRFDKYQLIVNEMKKVE